MIRVEQLIWKSRLLKSGAVRQYCSFCKKPIFEEKNTSIKAFVLGMPVSKSEKKTLSDYYALFKGNVLYGYTCKDCVAKVCGATYKLLKTKGE